MPQSPARNFIQEPCDQWDDWYSYLLDLPLWDGLSFLNYGYLPPIFEMPHGDVSSTELAELSENLYGKVVEGLPREDASILDVGSGRGGGVLHYAMKFPGASVTGLEQNTRQWNRCAANIRLDNVRFVCGSSDQMPFNENSFDLITSVESSHCYANMEGFFQEAKRVLRPGGHLVVADFRDEVGCNQLIRQADKAGLWLVGEEDITAGVVGALLRTTNLKRRMIREHTPFSMRNQFEEFAGTVGSRTYLHFYTRQWVYKIWRFQVRDFGPFSVL